MVAVGRGGVHENSSPWSATDEHPIEDTGHATERRARARSLESLTRARAGNSREPRMRTRGASARALADARGGGAMSMFDAFHGMKPKRRVRMASVAVGALMGASFGAAVPALRSVRQEGGSALVDVLVSGRHQKDTRSVVENS